MRTIIGYIFQIFIISYLAVNANASIPKINNANYTTKIVHKQSVGNDNGKYYRVATDFSDMLVSLSKQDIKEINTLISHLQDLNITQILIYGHADSRGIRARSLSKYKNNTTISNMRAAAIKEYLIENIPLDSNNILTYGLGTKYPVASNANVDGRASNRRVDIIVKANPNITLSKKAAVNIALYTSSLKNNLTFLTKKDFNSNNAGNKYVKAESMLDYKKNTATKTLTKKPIILAANEYNNNTPAVLNDIVLEDVDVQVNKVQIAKNSEITHIKNKPIKNLKLASYDKSKKQLDDKKVTLNLFNVDIAEVMSMLSKKNRLNILLSKNISGTVSVNLYDVSIEKAIKTIASAAGYAVENRYDSYFIIEPADLGKDPADSKLITKTYEIQYADTLEVSKFLQDHVSNYGTITSHPQKNIIVVEDTQSKVAKIDELIQHIDREPRQILIEAQILEIKLTDKDEFGVNWEKIFGKEPDSDFLFNNTSGNKNIGLRTAEKTPSLGFIFNYSTNNIQAAVSMLRDDGRVRTLSSPKLLALEKEQASVKITKSLGYKVQTTNNGVTTEGIELLETGIILNVTPFIDDNNHVLLDIKPEVSTGNINEDGIPESTKTEVKTQLVVADGNTIFIGGLIQNMITKSSSGLPVLKDLPLIGRLFGKKSNETTNSETIVLITPKIIASNSTKWTDEHKVKVESAKDAMEQKSEIINTKFK